MTPEWSTTGAGGGVSTRSAFTGIMIGMALAAISQTLVSTALPTIVGDLGGYDQLSWVVSAYLLTSAVVVPFAGALADRYGTSRLFQLAIVVFAAGSALAAVSTSMGLLIAARSIQGLGGGAIMTLAFTLVGHIVAPRERGRYQGYIASLFAVTSVLGPLVGGFFVDHLTWRLAFVTNVVLSGVALVVFRRRRLVDVTGPGGRLDLPGSALLVVALVSTMLVLMWGGQRHAWTSGVIIALVLIAIGSFVLFVACERRADRTPSASSTGSGAGVGRPRRVVERATGVGAAVHARAGAGEERAAGVGGQLVHGHPVEPVADDLPAVADVVAAQQPRPGAEVDTVGGVDGEAVQLRVVEATRPAGLPRPPAVGRAQDARALGTGDHRAAAGLAHPVHRDRLVVGRRPGVAAVDRPEDAAALFALDHVAARREDRPGAWRAEQVVHHPERQSLVGRPPRGVDAIAAATPWPSVPASSTPGSGSTTRNTR